MHTSGDQHESDVAEHDQDRQADLEGERSYRELLKVNGDEQLHCRELYRATILADFVGYGFSRLAAGFRLVRRHIGWLGFGEGRSPCAKCCQLSFQFFTDIFVP